MLLYTPFAYRIRRTIEHNQKIIFHNFFFTFQHSEKMSDFRQLFNSFFLRIVKNDVKALKEEGQR
jgi:hypothetical protein